MNVYYVEQGSGQPLILVGDRDAQVPVEEALEMYRLIANAELAIAPGSSHGALFDNEGLFTGLVLDFLLRQGKPSGA